MYGHIHTWIHQYRCLKYVYLCTHIKIICQKCISMYMQFVAIHKRVKFSKRIIYDFLHLNLLEEAPHLN